MGDLERRIAALEQVYTKSGGGGGGRVLPPREFVAATFQALAHVRREAIDVHPWRYETDMLGTLLPFDLAAYTCALQIRGHTDQAEARDLLLEAGDVRLVEMVDTLVARLRELRS